MSLPMIHVPEEQVAALNDVNLIRKHYEDELSVNELINLANMGEEMLQQWAKLPAAEKKKFLDERGAVAAHAFKTVSRPEDTVAQLVRDDWKKACAAWQQVMPKLMALS